MRWVKRNRPVGVIPFIIWEEELPRGQRVTAFLPHADDGRFIGASLSLLNRTEAGAPRNRVRIAIVCPGYRSVEGAQSIEEKSRLRAEEAVDWARELGYAPEQVMQFRADRTYARRRVDRGEQARMHQLIREERPTMVLLNNVADVAQHANHCTRIMVLRSLTAWLAEEASRADGAREVLIVEYPTLYVPILPPADKNVIVAFRDPAFVQIKHRANRCHRSQDAKYLEMLGKLVEAVDVLSGADVVCEARRAGTRFSKRLSAVALDPVRSRGEHFGITRLRLVAGRPEPTIVEERVPFPLSAEDVESWGVRAPQACYLEEQPPAP
ncbi:MAG TPA: PIG-L family deacetylase [bacterium]